MTGTPYLDGRLLVHAGDCAHVLRTLPDNSVDAVVTDPPYHLTSIVKRFGSAKAAPAQYGSDGAFARASRGFMGKQWDGGDIAFQPELWAEVAGAEREVVGVTTHPDGRPRNLVGRETGIHDGGHTRNGVGLAVTAPATSAAREWQGWGTALKPAHEPIVLARKPLSEPTVAANVLRWGTGAINVDACRVGTGEDKGQWPITQRRHDDVTFTLQPTLTDTTKGRWPANLIHSGSDEVLAAFPVSTSPQPRVTKRSPDAGNRTGYGSFNGQPEVVIGHGDTGSAARFFYTAKADDGSRLGSKHPTVKPLDLIQYLVRLITPRGGTVLDCFAGTGTTGEAAIREGCRAVLIEREPEYLADIERRCSLILAGPGTRLYATIKAKRRPEEPLPLFAEVRPQ